MTGPNTQEILSLIGEATPPLPAALERQTLALARAHLPPGEKRSISLRIADYMPSPVLVPALLLSAAVAFSVDAIIALAPFFPG